MRYFLITFSLNKIDSIGSLTLACETFPSHSLIEETVSNERKITSKVVVHSFYEFKNETDFNSYNS